MNASRFGAGPGPRLMWLPWAVHSASTVCGSDRIALYSSVK